MGGTMMTDFAVLFKEIVLNSFQLHGASGGLGNVLSEITKEVGTILIVPILFFIVMAVMGPLAQVGPMFSPKAIQPKLSKISLSEGFQRLFSMRSIFEFIKGVLKIFIIGTVSVVLLYPYFDNIDHFIGLPIPYMMNEFRVILFRLMAGILVVLFILAVIDLLYQRMEHMKKMRMSRKDIKDEHRQSDGDPHMKAKLRQLRMQKAQTRMIQSVPTADVIITNPTHFAIALKYDGDTMDAPVCVAKGMDDVALNIREVAKENDVQIIENKPLARALYDTVEIDETIPLEHYEAVAEVISYVFKLKGKMG
jgi:flagellar biosynthetic protein FlhB